MNRRNFLKNTLFSTTALINGPLILPNVHASNSSISGSLIFKPYFVQKGGGPHLLDWAYASDENWDAFLSNITSANEGVSISDTGGRKKFAVNVRWNIEGFGYLYITVDNGGEFYELPSRAALTLNLNFEAAKSRVFRNRRRLNHFKMNGWIPSAEVNSLLELSEEYFHDAEKLVNKSDSCGYLSQNSLLYALWVGEKMELEKAWFDIQKLGHRPDFFMGCDARGFYQMDQDIFLERFTEVFNYATITHYLKSSYFQDFEPIEGEKQFQLRTACLQALRKRDVTVEGRPLFWFYRTTTPDWLRLKSYDQLLKYVETHTRTVIQHYGNEMYAWEIVNELHDWANEVKITPDQTIELTKLACEVAKDTNPRVHRLINNCCPFAEYVQLKKWGELDAVYPQRTPYQFMRDLVDADVDFTITGQQMYFPYRDLSDTILLIERLEQFNRPVQLTEVGTSSGPTKISIADGTLGLPQEPYTWHRHWDEELQADWMESLYVLAYSRPWIEAVNWYDFVDPYSFIANGGLIRSPKGEKKAAFVRLQSLQQRLHSL